MKRKSVLLISLIGLFCASTVLGACSSTLPAWDDDYSFQNPTTPTAETDDYVTMDGVLDEDFWEGQRWLTNTYNSGTGDDIVVKSTTYFGEKGVYIGIEVQDNNVNYNEAKEIYYNSGLEVYFAREDYASVTNDLYRYLFSAGGMTALNKYAGASGDGYTSALFDTNSMPFSATMLQGGAINTSECTGYNTEIFLPYGMFEETIDGLWLNIAVIRSTTSAADSLDRIWYNFAANDIGGTWADPASWWNMNAGGLNAYNVFMEAGNGGTVTANRDYVISGGSVQFTIDLDEGYWIKSITLNGEDVLSDISTSAEGTVTYQTPLMLGDAALKVEFEQIPSDTYAINGNVTYMKSANAELNADISRILLYYRGIVWETTFTAESGTFTAQIPAGTYVAAVYAADGLEIKRYSFTVDGEETITIDIGEYEWGDSRILQFGDSVTTTQNVTIFEGTLPTNSFAFSAFFGVGNGHNYMDVQRYVTDLYLNFNNGMQIYLQLMNWDNNFVIKDENRSTQSKVILSADYIELEKENGGAYVMVFVQGDTVSFWMDRGDGTFEEIKSYTIAGLGYARLSSIVQHGAEGVSVEYPFSLSDIRLAFNANEVTDLYPTIDTQITYNAEQVGIDGIQETYNYGDEIKFKINVNSGYAVAFVTYNGKVISPDEEGYYTVSCSIAADIVISSGEAISVNGHVTLDGSVSSDLNADILAIEFVNSEGVVQNAVFNDGNFEFKGVVGEYTINVYSRQGYLIKSIVENFAETNDHYTIEISAATDWNEGRVYIELDPISTEGTANYLTEVILYDNVEDDAIFANTFAVSLFMNVPGGYAGTGNSSCATGLRFYFTDSTMIEFQALKWDGVLRMKFNSGTSGGTMNVPVPAGVAQADKDNEGLNLILFFNGNAITVYALDAGGEYVEVLNTTASKDIASAYLAQITAWGAQVDGATASTAYQILDAVIGIGKTQPSDMVTDTVVPVFELPEGVAVDGYNADYRYGDEVRFTVTAPQGYAVASVLVNGKLVSKDADGYYVAICGTKLEIVVTVGEALSLTGTVTLDGNNSAALNNDISLIEFVDSDGLVHSVEYAADGTFRYEGAVGEYTIKVYSKQGYLIKSVTETFPGVETYTLAVTSEEWNEERSFIALEDVSTEGAASATAEATVYDNSEDEAFYTNVFAVSAFLNIPEGYGATGELHCTTGLWFYFSDGSKIPFQVLKWNNTLYAKFASGTSDNNSIALPAGVTATDAEQGGFRIMLFFHENEISVYMLGSDGLYTQVKQVTAITKTADAELTMITVWGASVDETEPTASHHAFTLRDIVIGLNKTQVSEMITETITPDYLQGENYTVSGLQEGYQYGETVTFRVTAESGYNISTVTVNGNVITANEDGLFEVVCGTKLEIVVTVGISANVNGTVTLDKANNEALNGDISKVELVDADGVVHEVDFANGSFTFSGVAGQYTVNVYSKQGYLIKSVAANFVSGAQDYALDVSSATDWNDGRTYIELNDVTTEAAEGITINESVVYDATKDGAIYTNVFAVSTFFNIAGGYGSNGEAYQITGIRLYFGGEQFVEFQVLKYGDPIVAKFERGTNSNASTGNLAQNILATNVEQGGFRVMLLFDGSSIAAYMLNKDGAYVQVLERTANANLDLDNATLTKITVWGAQVDNVSTQSFALKDTVIGLNKTQVSEMVTEAVMPSVSVMPEEGAKVTGLSASYHYGETVTFRVTAESGYNISTVTVNGNVIMANEDGLYEVVCGTKLEIVVAVGEPADVSGTVTLDSANSEALNGDISKIELVDADGVVHEVDFANGTFTFSGVTGQYTVNVYSKQGYLIKSVAAEFVSGEQAYTLDISSETDWNDGRTYIELNDVTTPASDSKDFIETLVYDAEKDGAIYTNVFAVSAFFNVEGGYGSNGETYQVTGIRLYFTGNQSIEFQVLKWGDPIVAKFEHGTNSNASSGVLAQSILDTNTEQGGFRVILFFNGNNITAYMLNSNGTYVSVLSRTATIDLTDATLVRIVAIGAQIDEKTTASFTLKDTVIGLNKTQVSEMVTEAVIPSVSVMPEEGAKVTGLSASYHYGETVTFTVTAEVGYSISTVTVNGNVIMANEDGLYEVVCGTKLEIVVAVGEPADVSGTVTLDSANSEALNGDISKVELVDADGVVHEVDFANGTFTFSGVAGQYTVNVYSKQGYLIKSVAAEFVSGAQDYALDVSSATDWNDGRTYIELNDVTTPASDSKDFVETLVYDATKNGEIYTNVFAVSTFFNVTNGFGGTGVNHCVTGLRFYFLIDGQEQYIEFQVLKYANVLRMKFNSGASREPDPVHDEAVVDGIVQADINNAGMKVLLFFNGKSIVVYALNASGMYEAVLHSTANYNIDAGTLTSIKVIGAQVDETTTTSFTLKDTVIGLNKTQVSEMVTEAVTPSYVESETCTIGGLDESYHYGDTVTFTVTAMEGYAISTVTVNGNAITAGDNGSYEVICGTKLEIVVATVEVSNTVDISGFITLDGESSTELNDDIVKVELVDGEGRVYNGSYSGGTFAFSGEIGAYTINVYSKQGYLIKSVETEFVSGQDDYTLDISSATDWNDGRTYIELENVSTQDATSATEGVPVYVSSEDEAFYTNTFAVSAYFNVQNGYAGTGNSHCVTGLRFTFTNNVTIEFQVLKWDGNLRMKFSNGTTGGTYNVAVSDGIVQADTNNQGVHVIIFFAGDQLTVYALNIDGEYEQVLYNVTANIANATLTKIDVWGAQVDNTLKQAFTLRDTVIGLNKTQVSEMVVNDEEEITAGE